MVENHEKIQLREALMTITAVFGMAILFFICFQASSSSTQRYIVSSFEIFDMHEEVQVPIETAAFIWDTNQKIFDEFYVAFTEVASLPPDHLDGIKTAMNKFYDYSEQTALAYQSNNFSSDSYKQVATGQVLGEFIVYQEPVVVAVAEPVAGCHQTHRAKIIQHEQLVEPPDLKTMFVDFKVLILIHNNY